MNVKLRSRLAQKLDGEIAAVASMPARCAVLRVQRAILWLRHGREAEAREELDRLHEAALTHPRVELAAWLHLAEGLWTYFGAFGGDGRDRVRRARVMAAAGGLRPRHSSPARRTTWIGNRPRPIRIGSSGPSRSSSRTSFPSRCGGTIRARAETRRPRPLKAASA